MLKKLVATTLAALTLQQTPVTKADKLDAALVTHNNRALLFTENCSFVHDTVGYANSRAVVGKEYSRGTTERKYNYSKGKGMARVTAITDDNFILKGNYNKLEVTSKNKEGNVVGSFNDISGLKTGKIQGAYNTIKGLNGLVNVIGGFNKIYGIITGARVQGAFNEIHEDNTSVLSDTGSIQVQGHSAGLRVVKGESSQLRVVKGIVRNKFNGLIIIGNSNGEGLKSVQNRRPVTETNDYSEHLKMCREVLENRIGGVTIVENSWGSTYVQTRSIVLISVFGGLALIGLIWFCCCRGGRNEQPQTIIVQAPPPQYGSQAPQVVQGEASQAPGYPPVYKK